MLEEKRKVLRWVNDNVPFLRDIESFGTDFVSYWKDTFRGYKSVKAACPILSELSNLEKKLKTENSSDPIKQTLCNQIERLVEKLDEIYAESIRMIKPQNYSRELVEFSKNKIYYQDLIKQYGHSNDCGNQASLVSCTSTGDKDPKEAVIDTGNGAIENPEENVEVSSRHSATQGSRKEPSNADSRSSRRRRISKIELQNLRSKKEAEQRLQE